MSALTRAIKAIKNQEEQLVTPRLIDYLAKNPNVAYDAPVADRIRDLISSSANFSREARFGASTRGDCLRRQVFAYLGEPQARTYDYLLSNIYHDGTWRHLRWQAMGLQMGLFTDIETQFVKGSFRISMDAVNEDEGWLFELKGAFMIPDAIPEKHLMQIHTYFEVSGYDTCSYVVEDKKTQNWREWVVHPIPAYTRAVREEMDDLERAIDTGEVPPVLPACKRHEGPFIKCPYADTCLGHSGRF